MNSAREAQAFEAASRWPVWFGAQFFFGFIGVLSIMEKAEAVFLATQPATPLVQLLMSAALAAIIFTWLMRRKGARAS